MGRLTQKEEYRVRVERLVALLEQSNQLITGLGQYVGSGDSNRKVMEEVVKTNAAVIAQEHHALKLDEDRSGVIFTFDDA